MPLFVSVPTDSHVIQTRALITQQSAKVAALQARYLEQKKISDALEEKLNTAQQLLFETRASIATIGRVPPEVLSIVFDFHVQENHESPWLLMQVSRAWRGAALMTRSIWGRIILAPSNWGKVKKGSLRVRVWDGMEVCYKRTHLTRALKRAGATPLDLKIVFSHSNQRRRWHPGMTNSEHEILVLIRSIPMHQSNPRLRSLNISPGAKLILPSNAFSSFKFTDLVSLLLDEEYPEVIDQVVQEARGLRSVKVRAVSLEKMQRCKWWNQVEELEAKELCNAKTGVIRSILCSASFLTSLSLAGGIVSDNGLPIYLPLLKRLNLSSVSGFWPIDCPNITHLGFHGPSSVYGLQASSIHLPHLIELSFSVMNGHGNVLGMFKMPSVRTFEFQCSRGKAKTASALKYIWGTPGASTITKGAPSFPIEPEILRLRQTLVNQKGLARILTGRTRLRELYTVDMLIAPEFFDALMPVLKSTKKSQTSKGGSWNIPCPALEKLVVGHFGAKVKQDQVAVVASAKALIAARIKAGAPLERFAIRFAKDEEGWREFV
jgi:hypothetical protein